MKVKGTENSSWKAMDKEPWYEKLNLKEVFPAMPIVNKIKGKSIRVEFSCLDSVLDIVNNIRENNPRFFMTNAEVHRMCHYWGVYIARQCLVENRDNRKTNKFVAIADRCRAISEKHTLLERTKEELNRLAELAASEVISVTEFRTHVTGILNTLGPDFKPIIEDYVENCLMQNENIVKLKNRIRKRRSRANLRVVDGVQNNVNEFSGI